MQLGVLFALLAILLSGTVVSGAAPKAITAPTVKQFNLLTHATMSFEQREGVAIGTSSEPLVDVRKYDSRILTDQREDMVPTQAK
jgi:hypothetical protein